MAALEAVGIPDGTFIFAPQACLTAMHQIVVPQVREGGGLVPYLNMVRRQRQWMQHGQVSDSVDDPTLEEELARIGDIEMNNFVASDDEIRMPEAVEGLQRIGAVLTYQEDNVVRRAASLQKTPDANQAEVRIHPALATRLGLIDAKKILVSQDGDGISMSFDLDESVPEDCVWLTAATPESAELGALFAPIQVEAD